MEIEDKKILAEWLGWVFVEGSQGPEYFSCDSFEDKNRGLTIQCPTWNPDSNHYQFNEIWNKFNLSQKHVVLVRCKEAGSPINAVNLILSDLHKVCQIAVEVIKEA